MSSKGWWSLVALAGLVGGGLMMSMGPENDSEWTTSSEAALAHFEAGLEDWGKAYDLDAVLQFEAALELDPDFAMPMLFLSSFYPGREERRLWLDRLESMDLQRLTPRERYMVRYGLARMGRGQDDSRNVLEAFLEELPNDPFAIRSRCDVLWADQLWEEAETCYRTFLQAHPNWAMAQNRLGYIAMAQGRFSEAEEHFLTYRYVAPDQANPYLSMGELLLLLGRYEEADMALAEAVRIKPDLCMAHAFRSELHIYSGDFRRAEQLLRDLEQIPACQVYGEGGLFCAVESWLHYFQGDLDGARRALGGECLEKRKGFDLLAHRLAVMAGDEAAAKAMEDALHMHFEDVSAADQPVYVKFYAALEAHMQGVRALGRQAFDEAAQHFQQADELLDYWGGDRSGFKPFNRLNWLRTLERAGDRAKAKAVRHQIDAVNPQLVKRTHLPDLEQVWQRMPEEQSP